MVRKGSFIEVTLRLRLLEGKEASLIRGQAEVCRAHSRQKEALVKAPQAKGLGLVKELGGRPVSKGHRLRLAW